MPPKRKASSNTSQNWDTQDPPPMDPTVAQLIQLLQQQTVVLTQQQQRSPAPIVAIFKSFQDVHPPEFKGTADPIEAKAWLKEIEKAFQLVNVSEDKKTEYASYFLKSEASYWWESTKVLEGEGVVTWPRFTELFLEKYFPNFMKDQMEIKFLELKQGNMSVAEYEAKFSEMARFVPEFVNTDAKKAKRFQQGLKPWIRSRIAVFEFQNFSTVVQKAMIVESESEMSQREKGNKKRKFGTREEDQSQGSFKNKFNRKPEGQKGEFLQKPRYGNGEQGGQINRVQGSN